jgi:hypothetical protein
MLIVFSLVAILARVGNGTNLSNVRRKIGGQKNMVNALTRTTGMGGHQSARMGKDEWLTPPWLLKRLGDFDLDPCSPISRPWDTAQSHFNISDNGLSREWWGRVWCNPPYGQKASKWLSRCADHGNAIALIFARTETEMFYRNVWLRADGLLFLKGRLYFHHVTGEVAGGNSGAPSVLVAYGSDNSECLKWCGIPGVWVGARLIVEGPPIQRLTAAC